jgi:hypothetical protein
MTDVQERESHAVETKPPECGDVSPDGWACRLDAEHDDYGYPEHKAIEVGEEKKWSSSHQCWQRYATGVVHVWETNDA